MNHYAPYGEPWGEQGTAQTPFGFTGEPTDANDLMHLRARYYSPVLGVFPSLDPLEGSPMQPLGINRYAYANGNTVNFVDASGMVGERPPTGCSSQPPQQGKSCEDCCLPLLGFPWVQYWACLAACKLAGGCDEAEEPKPSPPKILGHDTSRPELLASVIVRLANCLDGACTEIDPNTGAFSLGTQTSEGIWTHTHYLRPGQTFEETGQTPSEGLTGIRGWDRLQIIGSTGASELVDTSLIEMGPASNLGYLLLTIPARYLLPGQPITADLSGGQLDPSTKVIFAFIPTGLEMIDWGNVQLAEGTYVGTTQLEAKAGGLCKGVGYEIAGGGTIIEPGDSGGGVFKDGRLIGNTSCVSGGSSSWFARFGS